MANQLIALYFMSATHTAKILVQKLNISVYNLQCYQLIVIGIYCTAEIQACISEQGKEIEREGVSKNK